MCLVDSFCFVFSLEQTCVPLLIVQQVAWTGNTSDSLSLEAGNVLSCIVCVSNVSSEVWSVMGAFVWAIESGGWFPWVSGDTIVVFGVQTLVAWLAEFQGEWKARLA